MAGFDFGAFFDESRRCLLDPGRYFASMPARGGFAEPILKVALYGVATAAVLVLSHVFLGGGALGRAAPEGAAGVALLAILMMPVLFVGLMFVGAVVIHLASAICEGTGDFEAYCRVSASIAVLAPINAAVEIFPWSLAATLRLLLSLYSIWMLYNALVLALRGKASSARVLCLVLALLTVVGALVP